MVSLQEFMKSALSTESDDLDNWLERHLPDTEEAVAFRAESTRFQHRYEDFVLGVDEPVEDETLDRLIRSYYEILGYEVRGEVCSWENPIEIRGAGKTCIVNVSNDSCFATPDIGLKGLIYVTVYDKTH